MFKNPLVRCALRLFTLAVMLGVLGFIVSTQPAQAYTLDEPCNTQWGYCIFNCAGLHGSAYASCTAPCEVNLLACERQELYEPIPAPYPVINNDYSSCLEVCLQCNEIDDFLDANDCYNTCFDYCWNTYRGGE